MHFKSYIEVFDTTPLTAEHPFSPHGVLFTYYPSEEPENLHYHNFLELGYCEKGTGVFIIDGEIIPFHGKCASIIYDGQVHIAKSINNEKSLWHFLYIDLSKLFTGVEANELKLLKPLEHDKYSFPNIIPCEEDDGIYALCREIMAEAAAEKPDHLAEIRSLVISLLLKHGRYFTKKEGDVRERASLMDEIGELLNYVNIHYMENITIDDLVEKTHMSKATLQRKMTAFFGISPINDMMRSTSRSIASFPVAHERLPRSDSPLRTGNSLVFFETKKAESVRAPLSRKSVDAIEMPRA